MNHLKSASNFIKYSNEAEYNISLSIFSRNILSEITILVKYSPRIENIYNYTPVLPKYWRINTEILLATIGEILAKYKTPQMLKQYSSTYI